MHVLAVIVVSGPHVLEPLAGAPPVVRSVRAAPGVPGVARVAVLAPDALLGAVRAACADEPVTAHRASSLHGGERPGDAAGDGPITAGPADVVLVLDAARPFVPADLGARVVDAVRAGHGAVVPVLPLSDTVKLTDAGRVTGSPDRAGLRVVQTPQGFAPAHSGADALRAVLLAALDDPLRAWIGAPGPVHTVPGDPLAFAVHDAWHRDLARATVQSATVQGATVQEEP